MNAPERINLPDIQSQLDERDIGIDAVGVSDVRYPINLQTGSRRVPTIANLSLTVNLPAPAKGTHMSRFIELLEMQGEPLDLARFRAMVLAMVRRLDARSGAIDMRFPYFVPQDGAGVRRTKPSRLRCPLVRQRRRRIDSKFSASTV